MCDRCAVGSLDTLCTGLLARLSSSLRLRLHYIRGLPQNQLAFIHLQFSDKHTELVVIGIAKNSCLMVDEHSIIGFVFLLGTYNGRGVAFMVGIVV